MTDPLYKKLVQGIEKMNLDPSEMRREELVDMISFGFNSLPSPSTDDAYLGAPLDKEPNLDSWEELPAQGKDRKVILTAGLSVLHGQPRWHAPSVMHNVNPAPLMDSVAAATVASAYNPNLLWDFVSAGVQTLERQVFRQLGKLAGWDVSQPDGVFTFGGKGCLTYAIRVGLNRCLPGVSSSGLAGKKAPVVVTSSANHYSIDTACALMGIGTQGVLRVPTLPEGDIDITAYEKIINETMKSGTPIACIISSGGNTLDMTVDPAKRMKEIAGEAAKRYGLAYRPFMYMDAVVGWPWMTFANYDWKRNHLGIPHLVASKLQKLGNLLGQTSVCDAFGCDFHKTGLAPYISSAFVIRRAEELHSIFKDEISETPRESYGNNFVQHHTIEHTRSAGPSLSAWVALQNVGIDGLRSYLSRLTEIGTAFQEKLPAHGLEHVNKCGLGFAGVFWPKPKNGPQTYAELINASDEIVNDCNKRIFAIYDELAAPENGEPPIVLRYLPQYSLTKSGLPAATLVVYPMALATSDKDIDYYVERIGNAAKRLSDPNARIRPFRFNPPQHVPK